MTKRAMLTLLLVSLIPGLLAAESEYVLGPQDVVRIWALGMDEISEPVRIDSNGAIDLPVIGRLKAAGLTLTELKQKLTERLEAEVREPKVSVTLVEYGSQPVSVLGAVNSPGVHQLRGRMTLLETLSLAGGLRADAGYSIRITRLKERGAIPLAGAREEGEGKYSVAQVKLKDALAAARPEENILIQPHDVITVPTAELIYVMGAVGKAGAFPLQERETVSALQALALAQGLGPAAAAKDARIIRRQAGNTQPTEIPVNLKSLLSSETQDVELRANDILFVPTSGPKKAAARVAEAVVQTATGVVIWRRP